MLIQKLYNAQFSSNLDNQYSIEAHDSVAGQTKHIDLNHLSKEQSETGGLHDVLRIAVNARVMLTANVDVSDGLVNGTMGTVVGVITDDENNVKTILIHFDNATIGLKCMQTTSSYKRVYPNAVPVSKHEVQFLARGKKRC